MRDTMVLTPKFKI